MKLLKESALYQVYKDGDSIVKVGPVVDIRWEAHILDTLKGVHGVPQVRGVTPIMGSSTDKLSLLMDLMPGQSLRPPINTSSKAVLASLYTILTSVYAHGVCHTRVTPEHILVDDDGLVSLVGFGSSKTILRAPMEAVGASPDFTGVLNEALFKLNGPHSLELKGGYNSIVRNMSKEVS